MSQANPPGEPETISAAARRLVARDRAAQGLPPIIESEPALTRLVALLRRVERRLGPRRPRRGGRRAA